MNDRTRAVDILREAKQILSDRLTEHVLEMGEEILADARGESYMNEIETAYEQLGMKLAHVNQMLSNLPIDASQSTTTTASAQYSAGDAFTTTTEQNGDEKPLIVTDTTAALSGPVFVATPALPAPKSSSDAHPSNEARSTPPEPAPHRSFQAFAAQIQAGDLLAAGRSLGSLFNLEEARAISCAATFADRLRRDPAFLRRAMQLRVELADEDYNRAVVLLHDCFGLTAAEATTVLQSLRRRLNFQP
jgi:hypothetical protein